MPDYQNRKYLLTIQNPDISGFTHDVITDILASMNVTYFCMADERATTGTLHTHVFLYRKGAIRESTIRRKFPAVHFNYCLGTCVHNRDYVMKAGKWANDPKAGTCIPGSFEEHGKVPDERQEKDPILCDIISDIETGKSTADIIKENPKFLFRSNDISILRETLTSEEFMHKHRELQVNYYYGATGAGKTRKIFDSHNFSDIYRITNYGTTNNGVRFDGYHGQSVIVFEEFASQIPISDMLNYLDRYPVSLPARYSDRVACYTTVYITSNMPLSSQYYVAQKQTRSVWLAFLRRINNVIEFLPDGTQIEQMKGGLS
jgi:hypothetical protein